MPWPVDRACCRLSSPFSRLAMFSRLLPGCLTPTCRQRRHNYIRQATCPGRPLFPGCPAAQCSLLSRLLPSRLFTRHYPLGRFSLAVRHMHMHTCKRVFLLLNARTFVYNFHVDEGICIFFLYYCRSFEFSENKGFIENMNFIFLNDYTRYDKIGIL